MPDFTVQLDDKQHWIPSGKIRTLKNGEEREKLIRVRHTSITLSAPMSARTAFYAHNLRLGVVRRGGKVYFTLNELKETREMWTSTTHVSDEWTRVKDPATGRPQTLDIDEAEKLLKFCCGTRKALELLIEVLQPITV